MVCVKIYGKVSCVYVVVEDLIVGRGCVNVPIECLQFYSVSEVDNSRILYGKSESGSNNS